MVTWEFFKAAFQRKYVVASYVDARRKEFLNLAQENKSVAEYEADFLHLSRYARVMVATDYERCIRFEDRLRDSLRVLIAPQRERVFSKLVEKAKIAEEVKHIEHLNQEKERGKNKREAETPVVGQRLINRRGAPGRNASHVEVRQLAFVYATHHREDRDAPDVITGMFFIYELPYTTLIDIGSTHSYVACNMTESLGDIFGITASEIAVISSLGQSVEVTKLFREVPLVVQGVTFLVDLMELLFSEFDLILGMDWLVKHRATLDCTAKQIVLRTAEDKEVVVIGKRRNYLSNVILVLRAEKLV
ncbi:uncharacterized protein LOC128282093 [Gossypium arboreum]|uniref:uncharacterized protein LOC128282093 n=1 Tax=Gossypium arboreum TaxID=29729 RepID=UPI0022F16BCF|nr:uncharacterized protein LOC128282093 [Gossypium arboreum]